MPSSKLALSIPRRADRDTQAAFRQLENFINSQSTAAAAAQSASAPPANTGFLQAQIAAIQQQLKVIQNEIDALEPPPPVKYTLSAVTPAFSLVREIDSGLVIVADNTTDNGSGILGLTYIDGVMEDLVQVYLNGNTVVNPAWTWTGINQAVFASVAGGLTQTVPLSGYIFQVGWALNATTILLDFDGLLFTGGGDPTQLVALRADGSLGLVSASFDLEAKAAATANVAILSGAVTEDGLPLAAGDIVFLPFQTTGAQNGPWVVQAGAWTRPPDFASGAHANGFIIKVAFGNTLYASTWECVTPPPNDVVGTDSLLFREISFPVVEQQAGYFYRGPSSGAPALPVFGPIVGSDLPIGERTLLASAVATANIAALTGASTVVDGRTQGAGSRPLLTAQTTGAQNGLWLVPASGAWTRPTDFATGLEAHDIEVLVQDGAVYADTTWICTTPPPNDVVDTNTLTFRRNTYPIVERSAGSVYAGPVSGAPAIPDFRALANSDIPLGSQVLLADACAVANLPSLSGTTVVIDGQTMTAGRRPFLVGQGAGSQNGLWLVPASGAWVRPTDFPSGGHAADVQVLVQFGTTYADYRWVCVTDAPGDVIDTNALVFDIASLPTPKINPAFFLAGPITGNPPDYPNYRAIVASDVPGSPLTKTDDTNVTLTLGGMPLTALLNPASLTLGWTGTLGLSRGGTAANLSATGGAGQYLKQAASGAAITVGAIPASDITGGAALTKMDDANVTLTLAGAPASALLAATSLTLGWSGQLPIARGGTGQSTALAAFDALSPLTTLGDTLAYDGSHNIRVAGQITSTRKFFRQTGTGTVSAIPTWDTLLAADIPALPYLTSFSAGNLAPIFTTSVATPTTTPALSFSLTSQAANLGFFGPASGATAAPTFRSLVVADLPTGIPNANLANSTIGLALGSTGTDANVTGSPAALGASLTLNLPSASAVNRGLLTAADWTTFNNKGTVSSVSAGNFAPLFNVSVATATSTPAITFTSISQAANLFYASPNGSAGNPGFRSLVAADVPALPYVTSVGLALPSLFSVSGSPVTGAGTLTGALVNQAANLVFAGPSTGVPAAPTFRALAANDIPALAYVTSVGLSLPSIFNVAGSPVTTSGTLAGTLATQTAGLVFAGPVTGSPAAPTFRALAATDVPALPYLTSFSSGDLSPLFTATVTNPTTTPALSFAAVAQPAALVYAGPVSGASAAPSFRALGATDLPAGSGLLFADAVSGANVATLSGTTTVIDGQTMGSGKRPLLAAQTTASQNGPWLVPASGAWTRPTDFATGSHAADVKVHVRSGSVYSDYEFECVTNAPSDVVDTNSLAFDVSSVPAPKLAANRFLASPSTGPANFPGFRAIASLDLAVALLTPPIIGQSSQSTGYFLNLYAGSLTGAGLLNVGPGSSVVPAVFFSSGGAVLTTTPTVGFFEFDGNNLFITDTTNTRHQLSYTSGSGVTSVGLALPSIFSISGSPVTGSGTLTGAFVTQAANTFLAGPSSGSAIAPTFRGIAGNDLVSPPAIGSTTPNSGDFTLLSASTTATTSSTTKSIFGDTRWRMQQNAGDESNAGVIAYGQLDATAMEIVGKGPPTPSGNRFVRIYDSLSINTAGSANALINLGNTSSGVTAFQFAGTSLGTTLRNGAFEFDGTSAYITAGGTRKALAYTGVSSGLLSSGNLSIATGTTLTTIASITLPANTLTGSLSALKISFAAQLGGASATFSLVIGAGTVTLPALPGSFSGGGVANYEATVVWLSSTTGTVYVSAVGSAGGAGVAIGSSAGSGISTTWTSSNTLDIKVQGAGSGFTLNLGSYYIQKL